jgi:hypothetical protein
MITAFNEAAASAEASNAPVAHAELAELRAEHRAENAIRDARRLKPSCTAGTRQCAKTCRRDRLAIGSCGKRPLRRAGNPRRGSVSGATRE